VFKLDELKKSENPNFREDQERGRPRAASEEGAGEEEREEGEGVGGAGGGGEEQMGDEVDEDSVASLMEIMNLTRDQAVSLLIQYGGDINEVIQTLLP